MLCVHNLWRKAFGTPHKLQYWSTIHIQELSITGMRHHTLTRAGEGQQSRSHLSQVARELVEQVAMNSVHTNNDAGH